MIEFIPPDQPTKSIHHEKINRLALKEGLKHIVCTEKDFVKLLEFKNVLNVDVNAVVMKHDLSEEIEQDILSRLKQNLHH